MNLEKIILAILATYSALTMFDWIIYMLKSAPKVSYFNSFTIRIGFAFVAVLVYWFINGCKFF
jgi:hypothetical protein